MRLIEKIINSLFEKKPKNNDALWQQPDIDLTTLYLGTEYGGWMLYSEPICPDSIIYSIGVGEDASFDLAMIDQLGTKVYAFDPTPKSVTWVKQQAWPPQFKFYPLGIANSDRTASFYPPENPSYVSHTILERPDRQTQAIQVELRRLRTLMKMLGHDCIDLLKMDIEGAEYEVIEDIVTDQTINVKQILVEFHHFFPDISEDKTKHAVQQLRSYGYQVFHVSPSGHEYSFIRL